MCSDVTDVRWARTSLCWRHYCLGRTGLGMTYETRTSDRLSYLSISGKPYSRWHDTSKWVMADWQAVHVTKLLLLTVLHFKVTCKVLVQWRRYSEGSSKCLCMVKYWIDTVLASHEKVTAVRCVWPTGCRAKLHLGIPGPRLLPRLPRPWPSQLSCHRSLQAPSSQGSPRLVVLV